MEFRLSDIAIDDTDIPFEEDIVRNPYNVKSWIRFLDHKASQVRNVKPKKFDLALSHEESCKIPLTKAERQLNMIYERSVKELPGSYKLWRAYLTERRRQCK